MAWNKSTRMKIGLKLRRIQWLLTILVAGLLLTQDYWQPAYYNWRCSRLSTVLNEKYGLVVRYGDPAEFYVPPLQAIVNDYEHGFFIGRTNTRSALVALSGVRDALAKYPQALIQRFLKAVFIAGAVKLFGFEAGGTYHNSWIYISATPDSDPLGSKLYEKIIHHELSSLLLIGAEFPTKKWIKSNAPDFKYLTKAIDVAHAATPEKRQDPQSAHLWYKGGFVHDYGMSSMNNDFNMYAELAMTAPQRLKDLSQKYPKIKVKTQILVEFYSSLAPELGEYFKSVGLRSMFTFPPK